MAEPGGWWRHPAPAQRTCPTPPARSWWLAFGLLVTAVFVLHLNARNRQADHIAEVAEELRLANQRLETGAVEIAEQAHLAALGAEIGVALTQRDGLAAMLQRCAGVLVKHLNAAFARIWTLSEDQNMLELEASAGIYTHNQRRARARAGGLVQDWPHRPGSAAAP
jgi:hypothetical protein